MNSGIMNVRHNETEKLIDVPEDFHQYHIWILYKNEITNIQTSPTKVRNTQLDRVSKPHVFTNTTMLNYNRPVKCNAQILNGRKDTVKGFGLVIIKPQNNHYTTLSIILYATKPTKQNKSNCNQTLKQF